MSWTQTLLLQSLITLFVPIASHAVDIAITLDDFPMADGPILNLEKRTDAFLESFKRHNIKAAFFCIGSHLKTKNQFLQLARVDLAGHFLANHTINHDHASEKTRDEFKHELIEMDHLLSPYNNFKRWYRFPYLDYGNRVTIGGSTDKHIELMKVLEELKYQDGYVTINTLDWSINQLLKKAINRGLEVNYEALKKAYLGLLKEWIRFYLNFYKMRYPFDNIKHSLLLHANDINALFMDDIIDMIKQEGWNIISPEDVFTDPLWRKNIFKKLEILNTLAPTMKPHYCKEALRECFFNKNKL